MTITTDNTTRPVNFIRFHGLTLLVVENVGLEYINAKALNDLVGLSWRKTRDTIQSGDNVILYGTRRLVPPVFDVLGDPRVLQKPVVGQFGVGAGTENTTLQGDLYLQLQLARMFLARVNTSQVRAQGNASAADFLLALQLEWARALHAYETDGIAVKNARKEARAELVGLMKVRPLATPLERPAFDAVIRDAMAELGYAPDMDPQQLLAL
jgi:hypothetical protein